MADKIEKKIRKAFEGMVNGKTTKRGRPKKTEREATTREKIAERRIRKIVRNVERSR